MAIIYFWRGERDNKCFGYRVHFGDTILAKSRVSFIIIRRCTKMFEYLILSSIAVGTSLATGMYYYFKSNAGLGDEDDNWLYSSYPDAIEYRPND
jgi:hypothetical protein